jgi:cobalamin synthase
MTALGTWLSGVIASRQLGGISGDVAGLSIIWGELFGCFAMIYAGNVALLIDLF